MKNIFKYFFSQEKFTNFLIILAHIITTLPYNTLGVKVVLCDLISY